MHFSNGKSFFCRLLVVVLLAGILAGARAGVITGQMSGTSVFIAYTSTTGTGTTTLNLTNAHSLTFGTMTSGIGNTGSFTNISSGSTITFQSPFQVNPPVPTTTPLWSAGIYSFTATTLAMTTVLPDVLTLSGLGILKDGTSGDTTPGAFSATVTSFGENSYNFSTYIYLPSLTLIRSLTNSMLLWTTNSTNFILQSTTNLYQLPLWTNLTNIPSIAGTNYVVSNVFSTTNTQRYFRLKH